MSEKKKPRYRIERYRIEAGEEHETYGSSARFYKELKVILDSFGDGDNLIITKYEMTDAEFKEEYGDGD